MLARQANLAALDNLPVSNREEVLALGNKFVWLVYHSVDPNWIIFSFKKWFINKTYRWIDLHPIFVRAFGEDPYNQL